MRTSQASSSDKQGDHDGCAIELYGRRDGERAAKHIISAGRAVQESSLPAATQHLVEIRASQINGCAACMDMHTKDAAACRGDLSAAQPGRGVARGERLQRGRACRAGAHRAGHPVADSAGGVTDEVWARASEHYDERQLGALVSLIAVINAFNRMNVITRQPAGDYQPGLYS